MFQLPTGAKENVILGNLTKTPPCERMNKMSVNLKKIGTEQRNAKYNEY